MKTIIKNWVAVLSASTVIISTILTTYAADSSVKKEKVKPYTLDYCIVSGEKLGTMGKAPSITYKDREIKFCCPGCISTFKKDPDKYIKKIEDAEKKKEKSGDDKSSGSHSGHSHN